MLRYAHSKEPIFSFEGMNHTAIATAIAMVDNRVVEVLHKCQHCGEYGAETSYQDSMMGCEYDVHTACRDKFKIEIERETGRYFYGG